MISGLAWLQLLDHHILDVRRDRRVARAREVGPELEIVTNSRHPRGDSPGQAPRQPRQVVDVTGQLEDWQRAVSFARLLPGVAVSGGGRHDVVVEAEEVVRVEAVLQCH